MNDSIVNGLLSPFTEVMYVLKISVVDASIFFLLFLSISFVILTSSALVINRQVTTALVIGKRILTVPSSRIVAPASLQFSWMSLTGGSEISKEKLSEFSHEGHVTDVSYSGPYPVLLAATSISFLSPIKSDEMSIDLSTSRFYNILSRATPSLRSDREVRISSSLAVIYLISVEVVLYRGCPWW